MWIADAPTPEAYDAISWTTRPRKESMYYDQMAQVYKCHAGHRIISFKGLSNCYCGKSVIKESWDND